MSDDDLGNAFDRGVEEGKRQVMEAFLAPPRTPRRPNRDMLGNVVRTLWLANFGHCGFNDPPWDEMPEGGTKEGYRRIGEVMFDRGAEVTYVRREEEQRIRLEEREACAALCEQNLPVSVLATPHTPRPVTIVTRADGSTHTIGGVDQTALREAAHRIRSRPL